MMKYQEPEMDIIEFKLVDICTASAGDDTTIWEDTDDDIGGGTGEGSTMPTF